MEADHPHRETSLMEAIPQLKFKLIKLPSTAHKRLYFP